MKAPANKSLELTPSVAPKNRVVRGRGNGPYHCVIMGAQLSSQPLGGDYTPQGGYHMADEDIQVVVLRHYAFPPPTRELRLECQIHSPPTGSVFIFDVWVKAMIQGGITIAEGRLFEPHHARSGPASLRFHDPGIASIHIPLSALSLNSIEQQRAGGDVELSVLTNALISHLPRDNPMLMTVPMERSLVTVGSDRLVYPIPQSEWIKVLRQLQWSELELIELPGTSATRPPSLARAFSRLSDATEAYRRGEWEDTMANCRKAFEALVQDLTGKPDMAATGPLLETILGEGPKAARVDALVKELGQFLHLARHEQHPSVKIGRADAAFSLHLTSALLQYFT